MSRPTTNDPETLALQALAATLADERRAQRFLDLTGYDAGELRMRASEKTTMAALFDFLGNYEPDLIAVAETLDVSPEELVAAARNLGA